MNQATDKTTGNLPTDNIRAMENNLLTHFSYLARRADGMEVIDNPHYLLVDSGLPNSSYNIIYCRPPCRFSCKEQLRDAVDRLRSRHLPLAAWVGPESQAAFISTLLELGLKQCETEPGMLLRPDMLVPPVWLSDLTIEPILDAERIRHVARVIAADEEPPADAVEQFFSKAQSALLSPDCPMSFFVGYRNGEPVATCEVLLADRIAGVYRVRTAKAHRRQGIGSAMTARAVHEAFQRGCRFVGLQASADGKGIYAKLGFKECCQFVHFH